MSIRLFAPAIKHRVRRVCTCGGVYTVDQVPIDLSARFLDSYSTYCIDRPPQSRRRNRCLHRRKHGRFLASIHTHTCGTFKHNIRECSLDEISMPFVVFFHCTCAISFLFIQKFRCSIIRWRSMWMSLLGIKIVKIARG